MLIAAWGLSAISCAKMAELIEMQLGMLTWVGPGNIYYMVCRCLHRNGHLWGCLDDWKAL